MGEQHRLAPNCVATMLLLLRCTLFSRLGRCICTLAAAVDEVARDRRRRKERLSASFRAQRSEGRTTLCVIASEAKNLGVFFCALFLVSFRAAAAKNPGVFFYGAALKTQKTGIHRSADSALNDTRTCSLVCVDPS